MKIFRVETDEDYQRCVNVRQKVFIEEQGCSEEEEIDEYEAESVHFLAVIDGTAASTGRFRIKNNMVKFERIATLAKFRGQGVGKAILEFMVKEAHKDYRNAKLVMHAQVHARGFYEKLGWQALGDIFDEAGIEHIFMVYRPSLGK